MLLRFWRRLDFPRVSHDIFCHSDAGSDPSARASVVNISVIDLLGYQVVRLFSPSRSFVVYSRLACCR